MVINLQSQSAQTSIRLNQYLIHIKLYSYIKQSISFIHLYIYIPPLPDLYSETLSALVSFTMLNVMNNFTSIKLPMAGMFFVGHGGHGGALVESIAFNRRVVGSTPTLAAM